MTCSNCGADTDWTRETGFRNVTLMTQNDAAYFANFEQGMEDYIPDSVDLCSECAGDVFAMRWSALEAKRTS